MNTASEPISGVLPKTQPLTLASSSRLVPPQEPLGDFWSALCLYISGCGLQGIHNIPETEEFREHPKLDLGDLNIISGNYVWDVVATEKA